MISEWVLIGLYFVFAVIGVLGIVEGVKGMFENRTRRKTDAQYIAHLEEFRRVADNYVQKLEKRIVLLEGENKMLRAAYEELKKGKDQ